MSQSGRVCLYFVHTNSSTSSVKQYLIDCFELTEGEHDASSFISLHPDHETWDYGWLILIKRLITMLRSAFVIVCEQKIYNCYYFYRNKPQLTAISSRLATALFNERTMYYTERTYLMNEPQGRRQPPCCIYAAT